VKSTGSDDDGSSRRTGCFPSIEGGAESVSTILSLKLVRLAERPDDQQKETTTTTAQVATPTDQGTTSPRRQ
jgi:hypothetical protein